MRLIFISFFLLQMVEEPSFIQKESVKSPWTVGILGSIPIIIDGICGGITLFSSEKEAVGGICFAAITPFTSTFFEIPLHLYIGTSLKTYTLMTVPKFLISLLIWGYAFGNLISNVGSWCEWSGECKKEYIPVSIVGNIVLLGINVGEVVYGVKKVNRMRKRARDISPFSFSLLPGPRGMYLHLRVRF